MLGIGALSPLPGFMAPADYATVIGAAAAGRATIHDPGGAAPQGRRCRPATPHVAGGAARDGVPVAILDITDVYRTDPASEAWNVYGTDDSAHPGVHLLKSSGDWAIGGPVTALARPSTGFPGYDLTPLEVRSMIAERGWQTTVGFQTRNPVHRAHEYLQKVALENLDGLLLHPLVGETKSDDIPADVRMACYEALLDGYYPKQRVLLATNPAWMRYAGPKEAVFHALIRRNYGCTHFIVGRDHAGVGSYYDTYAAHRIFEQYQTGRAGHRDPPLRARLLLPRLRRHGVDPDMPAPDRGSRRAERHPGARAAHPGAAPAG